jgi:hypothetical protein
MRQLHSIAGTGFDPVLQSGAISKADRREGRRLAGHRQPYSAAARVEQAFRAGTGRADG